MVFVNKVPYMWLPILLCDGSVPGHIAHDGEGGSCMFACQQRVLKTFISPGYLASKNGIVYIYIYMVMCPHENHENNVPSDLDF